MLKNKITKPILVSGMLISTFMVNLGGMRINNVNPHTTYLVNETVAIGDNNPTTESIDSEPNLHLKGINSDTRYRIYLDSTGDKGLPNNGHETYNDYLLGKGGKNHWYEHLIVGLSLDVTKYAKDKTDFLNQYKAVTFSYFMNYNFWNTWYGWSYQYGKNTPMKTDVKNYELTANDKDWLIFDQSDAGHSYNEKARLILKQRWDGNILNYNFYLGVLYNWKAGSTVKHASLASFKGDEYTFTKVSSNNSNQAVKVGELYESKSTFTINSRQEEINLVDFDNEIKRKATELNSSALKKTGILVQGYYGSLEVGDTTYIFSLIVRWLNFPNLDSTMLLNGIDLFQTMSINYTNGNFKFHYEDSFNLKQDTNSFAIPSEYLGMQMQGNFFLPFIYD